MADVVVIGGGPAGSTVSTLLAQQGYKVQLFERERFPRFHIGESLIPETYWVLKRLGMLEKMLDLDRHVVSDRGFGGGAPDSEMRAEIESPNAVTE